MRTQTIRYYFHRFSPQSQRYFSNSKKSTESLGTESNEKLQETKNPNNASNSHEEIPNPK